jgi:tripartite-type tricarboxylate transporter receptor subunit TctC
MQAGGPGDTLARLVAQSMTTTLKQQVIVENAAGAGGTIGSTKVSSAKPDGYTLLMIHISHATNPALYPKLRYDPVKDFEPIGLVADLPMVFVAKKDYAPNTFKDLITHIKTNKDKVLYAHAAWARRRTCAGSCSSARSTPTSPTCPTRDRARR